MVRIAEVEAGSIAEALELRIGSRVIRINGAPVRDALDLTFLLADSDLELEVESPNGQTSVYEIEREPGDSLGIVAAPDKIRECANECVFCFIDGNPPDVRRSLWLRDDDFRLSFTYGSYVTLTNLGPRGFQRLIDQRISPLYVSVHATDPDVRRRLLKNDRAGLILEHLQALSEAELETHTQVVLCPGWNDGEELDRTIDDLWALGPSVRTLSVVPVGLTRYNLGSPVRLLTNEEAAAAVDQVGRARERARVERGFGWCYAADELHLIADRPVPGADYYDDGSLVENGVGAVRAFLDAFERGLSAAPRLGGGRIRLVTGTSMAPFLEERRGALAEATGAAVDVVTVVNALFGDTVTIAGLLGGADILGALGETREGDLVLLPRDALNQDDLFIDSFPLAELVEALAPARIGIGRTLPEALATA